MMARLRMVRLALLLLCAALCGARVVRDQAGATQEHPDHLNQRAMRTLG